ncbi:NapC/NirT family cytochrome c [Campylobacter concisus]
MPVHYILYDTSGDKFCIVCHEVDPMVIAYNDDIHSNKGKKWHFRGLSIFLW